MSTHPIDSIIVDGVAVAKADMRSYAKVRGRVRVADADEIRNTDFSGQFGGLYVRELQADFDLDTSDTTTADNGIDCIIDDEGNRFKRVVQSQVETQREVTAAGDVTLEDDAEDIIAINKDTGASTAVFLPDAAVRTKKIRIVDKKGDAGAHPITILPKDASGQTIMGGASYVIDFNGGSLILTPYADGSGWF